MRLLQTALILLLLPGASCSVSSDYYDVTAAAPTVMHIATRGVNNCRVGYEAAATVETFGEGSAVSAQANCR